MIIEKLVDLYEKDASVKPFVFKTVLQSYLCWGSMKVGKSVTSIGEVGHRYKQEGKKSHVGCEDTFVRRQ